LFSKDSFDYDEEKRPVYMPKWYGEVISRKGEYEYNGKHVYAYYGANCGECPEIVVCG